MRLGVGVMLATVLAACGGPPASTTTVLDVEAPPVVVREWLAGLAAADYGAVTERVEPRGAALLVGLENGYTIEQIASLMQTGWSDALSASYWASFGADFGAFSEVALADLSVGAGDDIDVGEVRYAAVAVSAGDATSFVVARADGDGGWLVDLVATIGPVFVTAMRDTAAMLGDDLSSEVVRATFDEIVIPALTAAASANPQDHTLPGDLARLQAALAVSG
jgi:hypothetical protein